MSRPERAARESSRAFRAVLLDLDGTLADTLATIAGVANFALRSLGLPEHPRDAYRDMVGDGVSVLCARALPAGRPELHDELLARVRARYASHYLDEAKLYDGMEPALRELRAAGARLAVLTNKPEELAAETVEGLGVAHLFDCIAGQRDDRPAKPDPAGARFVCHKLGVAAAEMLYVGDTSTDMETAGAAGTPAIGVLWGFRTGAELREHGARWLVSHPREIVPIYRGEA
jgi:phosphoglycolate phosphatase